MARPKYPKPDLNRPGRLFLKAYNAQVDKSHLRYFVYFRNQYFVFLDISRLPNQIDWLALSETGRFLALEEKQPGKEGELTGGELEWVDQIGINVVTSLEDIEMVLSSVYDD